MTKHEMACELIGRDGCEGLRLKSYLCQAGKPTIGVGTIKYPDGTLVKLGESCTKEQAFEWLNDHLKRFVYPIVDNLQDKYKFSDRIYAALCSLGYNIGSALSGKSILAALESGDLNQLAEAFKKYILVNGNPSDGLKNRREIEIKYFI